MSMEARMSLSNVSQELKQWFESWAAFKALWNYECNNQQQRYKATFPLSRVVVTSVASWRERELAWKLLILWGLREWSATQHWVYYDSCTSKPSVIRVTPSLVWVAMTYVRLVPTSQRVIKILLRMIRALYEFHTIKGVGNATLLALSK